VSVPVELTVPDPVADVPVPWRAIQAAAPQLAATMLAYVAQMSVSMRPSTVRAIDTDLGILAGFLVDHDPALCGVADVERSHIEAFKLGGFNRSAQEAR
jgi:hypothetical protein